MLSLTLVLMGTLFLFSSLFPIQSLVNTLPSKRLKNQWRVLGFLVILFFIGYIIFALDLWFSQTDDLHEQLLVPSIFCFGGFFVLLVTKLSERTAMDLNEISILKKENITDPLMNIYNRRHFEDRLAQELFKSKQLGRVLSLLIIDIDHFKQINDTYGHSKGDDVLVALGHLIKTLARSSDVVARYGGEEICIIAPETTKEASLLLAERIRHKIEESVLSTCIATQEEIRVTLSIGISTHNVIDKNDFIKEADHALYAAKRRGRNQVIHASDLEASTSSCRNVQSVSSSST